jgi:hypothetical protein
MAIDFPASPTTGQTVTVGGVTWTWDGVKWVAQGTGVGVYLPLTGGTMTGDLILNRDAQVALGAATKQQADAAAGGNRVINGDMRIDQRNNGASGTATGYTVDRWVYNASQTGKGTWQRGGVGATSPAGQAGFLYQLLFTSSSAYASIATDNFSFLQKIEADMVSDFAWGTAGAQTITLSFWANSSLTGTFSGSICNDTGARVYPFTFSLPNASTWTKIIVTIPGDTAGTWVMSGNAIGMFVRFDLGCGANSRGPANAWTGAGNYIGVTGSQSVVATNGATFSLTGVKLEIGSVATPFNRQSLAKSLVDCQRYYQYNAYFALGSYGGGTQTVYHTMTLPVTMRAAPTATYSGIAYNNSSGLATNSAGQYALAVSFIITATGGYSLTASVALNAEL